MGLRWTGEKALICAVRRVDQMGDRAASAPTRVPIFKLPSDVKHAIARLLPNVELSMKGTSVSSHLTDSLARRARGRQHQTYLLTDKKHKKTYRAEPEHVASRSKYVLLVQKGHKLFYSPVELYKTKVEVVPLTAEEADEALAQAERKEIQRQGRIQDRLQSGMGKISSVLKRAGEGVDDEGPSILGSYGLDRGARQKGVKKAQHDLGLGDDNRDLDFEDEFDDDDEAKVTVDTTGDVQNVDNEEPEDLTADGKKIASILSKAEDMDDFSGSSDDEEMDAGDSSEEDGDDDNDTPMDASTPISRKRALSQQSENAAADGSTKRTRVDASSSSAPTRPKADEPPAAEVFVTDLQVKEQFMRHGRLTVKSLMRIMEDTWKYKGDAARKQLFDIIHRLCGYQTDASGVKYLTLKSSQL